MCKGDYMQKKNKGFTLIEMLVVVLIIGILASVALPQYRLAVEKTKISQAYEIMSSISKAQSLYYIVHNKYSTNFDKLEIDLPFSDNGGTIEALGFQWSKWGSKDGMAACKMYQKGKYCLQVDYYRQRYTCCSENDKTTKLCNNLGYTQWYADSGVLKCFNKRY